jgi:choline-glycine betaine transporter
MTAACCGGWSRHLMANVMELVSRGVFGLASLVLMLIALALSIYSATLIVAAFTTGWHEAGPALLGAIGYVVIAMAVFDVAKYFVEEEVIRGREMRLASEARRSLTKFMSTIVIAVFIEALVMVFREGGKDITMVLYPAAILFMGILTILGLGLYQRLSADVEEQVDEKDKVHEKAAPKPKKA